MISVKIVLAFNRFISIGVQWVVIGDLRLSWKVQVLHRSKSLIHTYVVEDMKKGNFITNQLKEIGWILNCYETLIL